jgi:hypothetical protein
VANISEVLSELQKSLETAKTAHLALDKAKATLEPLETAAKSADQQVNSLMREYAKLTNDEPAWVGRGRGGVKGPRKKYNISNESKIQASSKRAYTRAINSGASEKDAKKAAANAEKLLSEKLGVK